MKFRDVWALLAIASVSSAKAQVNMHEACPRFRELGTMLSTWMPQFQGNLPLALQTFVTRQQSARAFLERVYRPGFETALLSIGSASPYPNTTSGFTAYVQRRAMDMPVELQARTFDAVSVAFTPEYHPERAAIAEPAIFAAASPDNLRSLRAALCGATRAEQAMLGECFARGLPQSITDSFPSIVRGGNIHPTLDEFRGILRHLRADAFLGHPQLRSAAVRDHVLEALEDGVGTRVGACDSGSGGSGTGMGSPSRSGVFRSVHASAALPVLATGRAVGQDVEGVPTVAAAPTRGQVLGTILSTGVVGGLGRALPGVFSPAVRLVPAH